MRDLMRRVGVRVRWRPVGGVSGAVFEANTHGSGGEPVNRREIFVAIVDVALRVKACAR